MQTVVLDNLSKTYSGGKEAVKGVSLFLEKGEVFGFLGPNGAGKTTAVKLLNGMIAPTGGSCSVMGYDPAQEPEKVHAVSGVLTEHARMYDHMTGLENLVFYAQIFGIPEDEGKRRAKELLEKLELEEAAGQKLAAYSTGMRQKLSLARAMIHRPEVLFLDEPTSGLDPESAQNVNRLIRELAGEQGTTVFLCTHQLRYAQEICTRYGLIEEGRLLAEGTLPKLREEVSPGARLLIRADHLPDQILPDQILPDQILPDQILPEPERSGGADTERLFRREPGERGSFLSIEIGSEEEVPGIIRKIAGAGGNIYEVRISRPSLEDIYFALTAKGKEEKQL